MPSQSRKQVAKNELVFVNNPLPTSGAATGGGGGGAATASKEPGQGNTAVKAEVATESEQKADLEIIILGPPKRASREGSHKSGTKSASHDSDTGSKDVKPQATDKDEAKTSPLNESLLKRLEKQYGQKRILQADENTYIDYMDYF